MEHDRAARDTRCSDGAAEAASRRDASALSALLAELVASPDRDLEGAWDRGHAPGEVVAGRFELVRELGKGGFGVVFEARDRELKRLVAFKAIRPGTRAPDAAREALLRREADLVAQLSHPNIVTLHDVGRCASGPFLILELLQGETLAQRLRRGPVPAREAVRIGTEVGRALVHAHARGLLHRDLKPSNVFLTSDGGVKVLDFGLAHVFGGAEPAGSGTPGYMAPEQRRGVGEDARTDVYAVGILLHEMIAGERLFPDAREAAVAIPPPLVGIPRALAELTSAALERDPGQRPRDAAGVVSALLRIECAWARGARRRALLVSVTALAIAAGVAIGISVVARRAGPKADAPPPTGEVTPHPEVPERIEALRHFFLGEQCANRPLLGQDCSAEYRKAVALDPTLAAAHFQLAVWARWNGGSVAEQRSEIAAALRWQDRVPEPERLLIRAWAAHLDGKDDEALALFRQSTVRWPEDKRAFYEAGDILRHEDDFRAALPLFERAVELDPEHGWALGSLVESLAVLGREDALRAWVARWEAAPSPATLHALSLAYGWLGDISAASAAAVRGIGLGAGLVAQEDLLGATVFAGRYAEAQRVCRPLAQRGSGVRRIGYYALAALDAYQGRRRSGLAQLDALRAAVPEVASDTLYHAVRADYLAGGTDPAPLWAEVEVLRALDPGSAAEHAVTLARLGDLEHAAFVARGLRPGSALARTYEALSLRRAGDTKGALAKLRAVSDSYPVSVWRIAPLYLYGEMLAEAGKDREAIEALSRFERLYLPRMMWRSWAYPRSLVLLARAQARLGETARARAALERFFAAWSTPEKDDLLLAEARALRAGLGVR